MFHFYYFFIYLCTQNIDDDETNTFFNIATIGAELIAVGIVPGAGNQIL